MAVERRKYTEEFKREAVWLMENNGKHVAELARDLAVAFVPGLSQSRDV